jgi:hypothetical protein
MSSAFKEICSTYIRRTFRSWPVGICVFANLPNLIAAMIAPRMMRSSYGQCYGTATGFLGYLLWLHFREQIADQRRFILPGYLKPQILAFAAYSIVLFVVVPVEMIGWGDFHSVGLLAISLTFFALIGWCTVTLSATLFLICWLGWMATMWGSFGDGIGRFVTGVWERQADILLAASIAAGVLAVVRLCHLQEEDRNFRRRISIDARNMLRPRMTGEDTGNWRDSWASRFRMVLGTPTAPLDAGFWRRAWAWSSLGAGGAILIPLVMPPIVAMFRWMPGMQGQAISSSMLIALYICLCLVSGAGISPRWMQMWRHLETAIVFPLRREDFFKQIGVAIALNFAQAYMYLTVMLLVMMWWLIPPPLDWPSILAAMLAAAAFQFFSYANCLWLLRLRSPGWFFFGGGVAGIMVGGLTLVMAKFIGDAGHWADWLSFAAVVGVLVTVVAGLVLRDAWRRWLVAELG